MAVRRRAAPSVDPLDTLALVHRAQEHDLAARDELFARYLPRVRAIVALKLGQRIVHLAEQDDVVQEALLAALRGLESFEVRSDGTFYDWLSTIVTNRIRDQWRRGVARERERDWGRAAQAEHGHSTLLSSFLVVGVEPSPSEQAIGRETSERLETAMLELDERDGELLVLREICGMTYAELGARLELGESSVRSAVARAKARPAERVA